MILSKLQWRRTPAWRWLAGALFGIVGIGKLLSDSNGELSTLVAGGAPFWVQRIAVGIENGMPGVELVVAAAFLLAFGVRGAAVVGTGFATMFLVIAVSLPQGVECQCLGVLGGFSGRGVHVALALSTMALTVGAGLANSHVAKRV